MRRIGFALAMLLLTATASDAHYNMLFPDKAWAEKGEKVTFTYQFGHPFEHELFDAPKPLLLAVLKPKGGKDVLAIDKVLTPIKVDGADGKKVTAWQFTYTPAERGDYTFVLMAAQIKHEDDAYIQDTVKVVLHVQTQNGWDTTELPLDIGIDIRPQTRPYGILPGMIFKGRIVRLPFEGDHKGPQFGGGLDVEIEKFNPKPMKNLPPDELITFKTKSDPHGYFVTTLPEAGWWGVTALTDHGDRKNGKTVIRRATLWVHVNEKK